MKSPVLETFPNPHPSRAYLITHTCPEFTAVCPMTGQPDFGTIRVSYVPDRHCVELKSLKLYLFSFRNRGIYYEDVTNVILDDIVRAVQPRRMTVEGVFNVRGGISSVVEVSYEATRGGAAATARAPRKQGRAAKRGFGGAAAKRREPPRPERRDSLPARAAKK